MINQLIIALFLIMTSACATDLSYRYYGTNHIKSPKKPNQIEILYDKPIQEYEAIADFQGRGSNSLLYEFQKEAAKIGADAIIFTIASEDYDTSVKWAGDGIQKTKIAETFNNLRIFGTAIIYKKKEN